MQPGEKKKTKKHKHTHTNELGEKKKKDAPQKY